MAGSFGDYLENKLLNLVFGGVAFTAPATIYVGLSSTSINDAGGNITEPVGNGYARVAVTNNTTNWPSTTNGSMSNGTVITFPQATAAWAAGANMTDFFIADGPSGSTNVLAYGSLTTPKTFTTGDQPNFPVGALTFTLN